jgi:hypothetical protein
VAAWQGGKHFGAREHVRYVLAFFKATAPEEVIDRATVKVESSRPSPFLRNPATTWASSRTPASLPAGSC